MSLRTTPDGARHDCVKQNFAANEYQPGRAHDASGESALEIIMSRRNILQTGALSLLLSLVHGVGLRSDASAQALAASGLERDSHAVGAVFTLSNEVAGNRVIAFVRTRDGALHEGGSYATGGTGTGASLQSQNALLLSDDRRFLLAVNAGSNEISSFSVRGATLELRSRVSSHGTRPVSITEDGGLVYVVNAGAPSNVAGFELDRLGHLHELPGTVRPLSADMAGPGQIQVSPDGRELVVTERLTSKISSFAIDHHGRLAAPKVFASAGTTPFGFTFTRRGTLLVSEAATASLSSYSFDRQGNLTVVSPAVGDHEAAPCWVASSVDQRFAFVANAGSRSISSYAVERSGVITLRAAMGGDAGPGSAPQDMGLEPHGDFLYLLDRGNAGIARFDATQPAELKYLDLVGELPPFASGIAVY